MKRRHDDILRQEFQRAAGLPEDSQSIAGGVSPYPSVSLLGNVFSLGESEQLNLKTAVEKAGQGCAALILLGDATTNSSHRISPAG